MEGCGNRVLSHLRNYKFCFDITIYAIFINGCGSKQKSFPDKQ